jgi:hypothetical protein
MTSFNTLSAGWKIVIAVLVILFFGYILTFFLINFGGLIFGESDSTLYLWELNESNIPNGNIISLTDENFNELPKLASVIRDKKQKPEQILETGNRLYTISLTMEERYIYGGLAGSYLEYEGKYYFYDTPSIH